MPCMAFFEKGTYVTTHGAHNRNKSLYTTVQKRASHNPIYSLYTLIFVKTFNRECMIFFNYADPKLLMLLSRGLCTCYWGYVYFKPRTVIGKY